MNKAEIMTLLGSKVKPETIRIAIVAGKMSGILMGADRDIERASNFRENANWKEIIRMMEGDLEKEIDYRSESMADKGGKIR